MCGIEKRNLKSCYDSAHLTLSIVSRARTYIISNTVEYTIFRSALGHTEIFAIKVTIILSRTARNALRLITFEANKSTIRETTFSIIITVRLAIDAR